MLAKKIYSGCYTVDSKEDIVVFIIGMRINKLFSFSKWLPVFMAMPPMIKELYLNRELGFLHIEISFSWKTITLLQYWKSFEQLEFYAKGALHLKAWKKFNQRIGSDGTVGIYHETYKVEENAYESIYANMPLFGLAKAKGHRPVNRGLESARERLTKEQL